jgi:hypothetical protein
MTKILHGLQAASQGRFFTFILNYAIILKIFLMEKNKEPTGLKRRNPKWNPNPNVPENERAKYPYIIHHSELVRDAKVIEGKNASEMNQNLAAPEGMNFAKKTLEGRWKDVPKK